MSADTTPQPEQPQAPWSLDPELVPEGRAPPRRPRRSDTPQSWDEVFDRVEPPPNTPPERGRVDGRRVDLLRLGGSEELLWLGHNHEIELPALSPRGGELLRLKALAVVLLLLVWTAISWAPALYPALLAVGSAPPHAERFARFAATEGGPVRWVARLDGEVLVQVEEGWVRLDPEVRRRVLTSWGEGVTVRVLGPRSELLEVWDGS